MPAQGILVPEPIGATRQLSDWLWQLSIELLKLTRPRRFHPSDEPFRRHVLREPARSNYRAGRPSRLLRIVCPKDHPDIPDDLSLTSRIPVEEVCGWLRQSQRRYSCTGVYIKNQPEGRG